VFDDVDDDGARLRGVAVADEFLYRNLHQRRGFEHFIIERHSYSPITVV